MSHSRWSRWFAPSVESHRRSSQGWRPFLEQLEDRCLLSANSNAIYWTDSNGLDIGRANLDGSAPTVLISNLTTNPGGIALDTSDNGLFWTQYNGLNSNQSIWRSSLDGTGAINLLDTDPNAPLDIALDPAAQEMYWTQQAGNYGSQNAILRANFDGSGQTVLTGTSPPLGLALDIPANKIFWTTNAGEIRSSDLNGNNMTTVVSGLSGAELGVGLDLTHSKMYWTEWVGSTGNIRRANLDGTDEETLLTGLPKPVGIALDVGAGQMYWTDSDAGDIRRASLDGTGMQTLITGLQRPWQLALENSGPTLVSSSFFGGPGDQRGTGISITNSAIYVSGTNQADQQLPNETGLLLKYDPASLSSPRWSQILGSGTEFGGVTATSEGVYAAGENYSLTTDNVGGKEGKTIVAKYTLDGSAGPGTNSSEWLAGSGGTTALANFFAYSGVESFEALTTTVEGASPVIYAAGGGQPDSYYAYLVAKYDTAGHLLGAATDSSVGIALNQSYVPSAGGSDAHGLAILNGDIFLSGDTGWSNEGDSGGRPVLWEYDSNLNLVQRIKDTTLFGSFKAVTAAGGALYAVGLTYTPAISNSEDYLIEKYDANGNLLWRTVSGGPNTDVLTGVVAVGSRLFAVGYTDSEGAGGYDAVVLEIDPTTGTILSKTLFGGAQDDKANGVATDGRDLYVVGESRSFASAAGNAVGQNDIMLLRYTLGAATHFSITAPASSVAGTAFSMTITALDASGHTASGYTGTVHFTSTDKKAALPADYTFVAADAGVHTFKMALVTAGSQTITATDTVTGSITGKSSTIKVSAAALNHLKVKALSPTTAGVAFSITVVAQDAYNNTVTGYTGTVHFTSTDGQAVLPADYTFISTNKGVHIFSGVTLKTAGTQSITATDTVTASVTASAGIAVKPGKASTLGIIAPSSVTQGVAFTFTVTALDAYGNVATGYVGTVHFSSSDAAASLPANFTFLSSDGGVEVFSAILNTTGTQSLTATDTVTSSITGTDPAIQVNAGAAAVRLGSMPSLTEGMSAPDLATRIAALLGNGKGIDSGTALNTDGWEWVSKRNQFWAAT